MGLAEEGEEQEEIRDKRGDGRRRIGLLEKCQQGRRECTRRKRELKTIHKRKVEKNEDKGEENRDEGGWQEENRAQISVDREFPKRKHKAKRIYK